MGSRSRLKSGVVTVLSSSSINNVLVEYSAEHGDFSVSFHKPDEVPLYNIASLHNLSNEVFISNIDLEIQSKGDIFVTFYAEEGLTADEYMGVFKQIESLVDFGSDNITDNMEVTERSL